MKLYYAPGASSLAPHIALREAGLAFELEKVDIRGKKLASGADFFAISPKGYVPALVLDDGQLITEGAAMVQYIAGLAPESGLAPPAGTLERVRLQEWLTFISSEVHKSLGIFFAPQASDDFKRATREKLASRLTHLERGLEGKRHLLGDTFTVADAYAFYALRVWQGVWGGELTANLAVYFAAIAERPAVKDALRAEGFGP